MLKWFSWTVQVQGGAAVQFQVRVHARTVHILYHTLVRHPRPIFNKHYTLHPHTTMATSEDDDDAPMEAPPGKESNEEDSDVELEGKKKAVEHIIERSRRNVYPDRFLSYHASIVNK